MLLASVLANTSTRDFEVGMKATQMLDGEWKLMKRDTNRCGYNFSSEASRQELAVEIRAAQWKRMCGTNDRWLRFCEAVQVMRATGGELPNKKSQRPCQMKCAQVESMAGGLVDCCCHPACDMEAAACCIVCGVPLCMLHLGPFNTERDLPQDLQAQSRCHEHLDLSLAEICPCQECKEYEIVVSDEDDRFNANDEYP